MSPRAYECSPPTTLSSLEALRPYYASESRDLLRVLMNAVSITEANLALQLLLETVPSKVLVRACNLREVICSLPKTPTSMRVSDTTLAEALGMECTVGSMGKTLPDGTNIWVMTAGNLVLDIVVGVDDKRHYWNPVPVTDDVISGAIVDLLINSDYLLAAAIEMATTMGVVFNPKFYVSIEDWHLDNAADVLGGLEGLF